MSTRVPKGNTVFRPVTKARARIGGDARQSSATPDAQFSFRTSHGPAASSAASSMPPPSTVPQRSQPAPVEDTDVPSAQEDTPGTRTTSASDHGSTFAISVPTRNSSRPPAVQSFTASRLSTPVPPRVQPGQHGGTDVPVPRTIAIQIPSRSVPLSVQPAALPPATSAPLPPSSLPNEPPLAASANSENQQANTTSITDAQIDPALLEAVVTALQHANEAETQDVQTSTLQKESQPHARLRSRPRREARTSESLAGAGDSSSVDAGAPSDDQSSDDETNAVGSRRKGKKRASTASTTGATRKRRSRAPSIPPYDPTADPGEELDPTAITMAELCDDTGRGRVSTKAVQIMTNHAAWRASNREKRARMRAVMEAKKYGRNPDTEDVIATPQQSGATSEAPDDNASEGQPVAGPSSSSRAQSAEAEGTSVVLKGAEYDYTQSMATSRYNVQVRIGPNGETMIDETSLLVDRQEEDETANYTHIEESDTTKFVNSMSYSKKLRGSRWSAEETELFFDALSQFGENYELISYVLPGRDRKACKNKFKAEDKRNSNRITHCLKHRRPYDMQTLSRLTGKDFSGPTPEIRAPTPLRLPHDSGGATHEAASESTPAMVKKQSATPALEDIEAAVEVVGGVDDIEDT